MTEEELSKGFTGIEINGVRFSNIKEMLIYMNKQRVRIIDLEKENAELKKQLTEEQNLNAEIKARFVKCNTCTKEMKKDCLMWTENLCEGERCNELIDIQELIMKGGMIS